MRMDSTEEKKEILMQHGFMECNGYWVRDDICILSELIAESSPSFISGFLDATERRSVSRTNESLSAEVPAPREEADDFIE